MQYEVSDFDEFNELAHRKGWTDGLPVMPPTRDRVARFLEEARLAPDKVIGLYEERRIPVTAEKLAINAVMAGCLPEYFPTVVAIADAMLDPAFPIHVANSSTGSFTVGFIVKREAVFERTRRSVAWIKTEGWKVQMHKNRREAIEQGDEDRYFAIAKSSSPENLLVVVCGGPAGAWPYYLYSGGVVSRPVTRKIAI